MQKVSICCALLIHPKVILLDEPMVGLDPKAIRELKEIILELKEQGATVLISTHMLEMVEELWDVVCVMEKGKILGTYKRDEVGGEASGSAVFLCDGTGREEGGRLMRGLLYLHLTGTKNRIRRSLKKAGTWVFLCLMGLYAFLMLPGLGKIIRETSLDRPEYFVLFLTAIQLYFGPANYAAYAKRKGLLFLPCDVQMVFPAPVSPKLPLFHACVRTQISNIFISLLLIPAGVFWFHAGVGEMILFALFSILGSGAMEVCLVICLYGNERFSERTNRAFGRLMYLMIGCFLVMGAGMIWKNGMSWQTVLEFLSGKWIQMIPILGWEIGVYRLLFLGPELLSVTAALLYLLALLAFFILAYRMKCSGQYYEDAMKFADDYQEARNRAKKGQAKSSAKKRPLRRTFVKYRGGGAKAVFYRQYLEAKKSRGFLFGSRTVWALFVAVFVTWMICREGSVSGNFEKYGGFSFLCNSSGAFILYHSLFRPAEPLE